MRIMPFDRATFFATLTLIVGLSLAFWFSVGMGDGAAQDYELFTRYTARLAFFFFLPVFTLGALNQLMKVGFVKALRPKRRLLGLTFGAAHLCHMVAILMLHDQHETWFTADDAAALVIYSLLVLQVATSNNWSVRAMGRSWRVLHWVASYAIFTGFFVTYLLGFRNMAGLFLAAYSFSPSALGYFELRPFSIEVVRGWAQLRSSPGLIEMTML
jgi:DMSO/TMAO reductase YedYZ heme-binding membrane subunit